MPPNPLPFKETQLFDWDAEPSLERSSSFFVSDELYERHALASRKRRRPRSHAWLVATIVVGLGAVAMFEMASVLRSLPI